MRTTSSQLWISRVEASRRLHCSPRTIDRLAAEKRITVRLGIGGMRTRYGAESVDRLVRETTVEAIAEVSRP